MQQECRSQEGGEYENSFQFYKNILEFKSHTDAGELLKKVIEWHSYEDKSASWIIGMVRRLYPSCKKEVFSHNLTKKKFKNQIHKLAW